MVHPTDRIPREVASLRCSTSAEQVRLDPATGWRTCVADATGPGQPVSTVRAPGGADPLALECAPGPVAATWASCAMSGTPPGEPAACEGMARTGRATHERIQTGYLTSRWRDTWVCDWTEGRVRLCSYAYEARTISFGAGLRPSRAALACNAPIITGPFFACDLATAAQFPGQPPKALAGVQVCATHDGLEVACATATARRGNDEPVNALADCAVFTARDVCTLPLGVPEPTAGRGRGLLSEEEVEAHQAAHARELREALADYLSAHGAAGVAACTNPLELMDDPSLGHTFQTEHVAVVYDADGTVTTVVVGDVTVGAGLTPAQASAFDAAIAATPPGSHTALVFTAATAAPALVNHVLADGGAPFHQTLAMGSPTAGAVSAISALLHLHKAVPAAEPSAVTLATQHLLALGASPPLPESLDDQELAGLETALTTLDLDDPADDDAFIEAVLASMNAENAVPLRLSGLLPTALRHLGGLTLGQIEGYGQDHPDFAFRLRRLWRDAIRGNRARRAAAGDPPPTCKPGDRKRPRDEDEPDPGRDPGRFLDAFCRSLSAP